MSKNIFKVSKRKVIGRKVKTLRSEGLSPANIFGSKIPSVNISIDSKTFLKLYSSVGESSLIYLKLDDEKEDRPVFIREVSTHPVTGKLLHVSFNQVNLKEKVSAPVPIELTGESPAEKEKLGILVQQLDELDIKALPADMPEHIQIDVSNLSEVGSNIKVSDLNLDSKLEIETDSDTTIVQIEALAREEVKEVVAAVSPESAETAVGETTEAPKETTPVDKKEETKKE